MLRPQLSRATEKTEHGTGLCPKALFAVVFGFVTQPLLYHYLLSDEAPLISRLPGSHPAIHVIQVWSAFDQELTSDNEFDTFRVRTLSNDDNLGNWNREFYAHEAEFY